MLLQKCLYRLSCPSRLFVPSCGKTPQPEMRKYLLSKLDSCDTMALKSQEKAECTHLNCSEQGNNPARLQGLFSPLRWGTNKEEETFYSENKFLLGSKKDMSTN